MMPASPTRRSLGRLLAVAAGTLAASPVFSQERTMTAQNERAPARPYIGMWVPADGYVRHELLPNSRYDEARGNRQSAYQGRYTVTGNHIDYVDDTGFTADGDFRDGVLHHAGMVLYRRP